MMDGTPPPIIPEMQDFETFERETERELKGKDNGAGAIGEGVERSDFQAFMPGHAYIFVPTGELWPGSSVNAMRSTPTRSPGATRSTIEVFSSA